MYFCFIWQGESLTKKKDRKSKKEGGGSDEDKDNANGNDDDWGENEDDAEWGEDTSEDAVRRRMEALSGGLGGLVIDNDMERFAAVSLTTTRSASPRCH